MKALLYLIRKSVKNGLLELKKKPAKLIVYVIFFAFLILSLVMGNKEGVKKSSISTELYGSIATGLIIFFTVPDLLMSLNNGASFFRGADVNLVFTAPIKPQKILIYGFCKQAYTVLISLFFLLFQIPNLYRFSNVKSYGIFAILIAMFILLLINSIIKLLLYSLASKSDKNKTMIRWIFKGMGMFGCAAYFICLYNLRSPGQALNFMLNNKVIRYIPVYGWVREISFSAINGLNDSTYIYIMLSIALAVLAMYTLYSMDMDYFEDVLSSTEIKENAISAARSGDRTYRGINRKGKVRKVQYTRKGHRASAILFRQILEYRKTGFGLINFTSAIYVVIAVTAGLFLPVKDLRIIFTFSSYLLLIFSFAGKWQQELARPYVFILPDTDFKKVIYSTLVDNIKNLIDGCLIFFITGFLFRSELIFILINILAFTSIGALFVYGGVLTYRILGNTKSLVLISFMRIGLLLLIVIPGLVIFGVINGILNNQFGQYLAYLILIGYNIVFSSIIILLGKGIFENIELA